MSILKKSFILMMFMVSLVLVACKTTTTTTTGTTGSTTANTGTTTNQTTTTTATTTTPAEPTVIRIAVWWQAGDDPTYIDPATGEYNDSMPLAVRQARLDAVDTVLDELNVQLEWVQYSSGVTEEILQTVLAGDPVAELVGMWGGSQHTILQQNVLQDVSAYRDAFGEEASWMLGPMDMFGKTMGFAFETKTGFPFWPLVYNVTYLEGCSDLINGGYAENGKVVLPSQLWEEGKWDWPTFKDYLTKVKACTTDINKPGGTRGRVIHAYEEDYRQAAQSLAAANGEYMVRPDGTLGIDSPGFVQAVSFLQDLKKEGIMWSETYGDGYTPGWTWNGNNFSSGEAVFTSMHTWGMDGAVSALTGRGEELGMVPWPVGPQVKADPETYQYHSPYFGGNTMGVPKGVPAEKVELAIKAWALYNGETFKNLGYANTQEYIEATNASTAAKYFPVADETYGSSLIKSYNDWVNAATTFDPGNILGVVAIDETYAKIISNPASDAATTIAAEKAKFQEKVTALATILNGNAILDNQKPVIKQLPNTSLVFDINTDLSQVDWSTYFESYDVGLDTDLNLEDVTWDYTLIDNTKPNSTSKLKATVTDSSNNKLEAEFAVSFYDSGETVAPVIARKNQDAIQFVIDHNVSTVDWKSYVTVTDKLALADGTILTGTDGKELTFDLASLLTYDISQLDATTPDTYTVELSVTDYAGNTTTLDLEVTIVAE